MSTQHLIPDYLYRHPERMDNPWEHAALSNAPRPNESIQVKRGVKTTRPRQGFLASWFSPSPARRVVPRTLVDNLVASFWTGGPPTVSRVRDISSLGLYVVTPERWYPGTIIRMTLTKTKAVEGTFEKSICVCTEAVRWGNDGVGLRFAVDNHHEEDRGQYRPVEGADRRQLGEFLKLLLPDDQQTRNAASSCEDLSQATARSEDAHR